MASGNRAEQTEFQFPLACRYGRRERELCTYCKLQCVDIRSGNFVPNVSVGTGTHVGSIVRVEARVAFSIQGRLSIRVVGPLALILRARFGTVVHKTDLSHSG